MEIKQYIQTCIDQDDIQELSLAWNYAGRAICTSDTRFYKSGEFYYINDINSAFNKQIFYCNENYTGKINWAEISTLDEANQTTIKNGLTAICFDFFNKTLDLDPAHTIRSTTDGTDIYIIGFRDSANWGGYRNLNSGAFNLTITNPGLVPIINKTYFYGN